MKKSAYILGLFGSVILSLILLASLILNYSYNIGIFSFIFLIELVSVIVYLVLLNREYFGNLTLSKEHKALLNALTIWSIIILPFNLFLVNFTLHDLQTFLIEFFIGLFRSVPNYIVIIPLAISFYIMNKNNFKRKNNHKNA